MSAKEKYGDIIDFPYKKSNNREHLSMEHRAAQFSAFAALTGYETMVENMAAMKLNDERIIIGEDQKRCLDQKLQVLLQHIKEKPEITVRYYDETAGVNGGKYLTFTGNLKRIDECNCILIFDTREKIYLEDVLEIESDILDVDFW